MINIVVLKSAFKSLRTNLLRTVLTMIGIIIGITSVILISSIGKGAVAFVTDELTSFGAGMFQVTPGANAMSAFSGGGEEPLTMDDAEEIQDAGISNIEYVMPLAIASRRVSANDESTNGNIFGMTHEAEIMIKPKVIYGRFFEDYDEGRRVTVLGIEMAEELFGENTDPVGESIKIEDHKFTVIGVTKGSGSLTGAVRNTSVNVPIDVLQDQITGDDELNKMQISVYDTDLLDDTMEEVEYVLRDFRDIDEGEEDDFLVSGFQESLDTITTITDLLTLMIAGISAISLVVGGVGVMNIMFVSVTERTKEIGLLKSIGAKENDILMQFLVEAVVMTTIGGLIGIVLGLSGAFLITIFVPIPFIMSTGWILSAVVISSLVGITFGVYPARRASKLSPIDALRRE